MNIIQACENKDLLLPAFKGGLDSWWGWFVWLKAVFGIALDDKELAFFTQCTGRAVPLPGGYGESWVISGRRSGKSFINAVVIAFLSLFVYYSPFLAFGEVPRFLIVASDRSQSQILLSYIRGILESNPVFNQYIVNSLRESIELSNGCVIEVASASFRLLRGRTLAGFFGDEASFWRGLLSANPAGEIISAARPSLTTVPIAKLFIITSAYSRQSEVYRMYERYYGKDSDVLIWKSTSTQMNPTISEAHIQREMEKDATSAKSEYFSEFRTDIENFLSLEVIKSCAVIPGRLAYQKHTPYFCFVDPSGGVSDEFCMAIAHFNFDKNKIQIDYLRGWTPPFQPSEVVEQITTICESYRISRVCGDKYSANWVIEAFSKVGMAYQQCSKNKSQLYLEFEGVLNTGQVELQNNKKLIDQLAALERRTGSSGRDHVDHPPGFKDDFSNAAAGACDLLNSMEESFFAGCDLS